MQALYQGISCGKNVGVFAVGVQALFYQGVLGFWSKWQVKLGRFFGEFCHNIGRIITKYLTR